MITFQGQVCVKGKLSYIILTPNGIIRKKVSNLVVDAGRNLIRDLMAGKETKGIQYIAIGTGSTTPAPTDTKLESEVYRDTITRLLYSNGVLTVHYYLDAESANGYNLTEAGLFGGSTATSSKNTGILYSRVTFPVIQKNNSLSVLFVWDLIWEAV